MSRNVMAKANECSGSALVPSQPSSLPPIEEPARANGPAMVVLLVENNPGDVRLTQEAFRDSNMAIELQVVGDGVEALAYLRKAGAHAESRRPDLILLDLNLPKMDGRDVLAEIKGDETLKSIPTVILSTSQSEADITASYQLQANCYLSKPIQFDKFENLVRSISDFWLTKAQLPPYPGHAVNSRTIEV